MKVSMDGRGRALDNVFVERLWRTVKYEEITCAATTRFPSWRPAYADTSTSSTTKGRTTPWATRRLPRSTSKAIHKLCGKAAEALWKTCGNRPLFPRTPNSPGNQRLLLRLGERINLDFSQNGLDKGAHFTARRTSKAFCLDPRMSLSIAAFAYCHPRYLSRMAGSCQSYWGKSGPLPRVGRAWQSRCEGILRSGQGSGSLLV